MVLIIYSVSCFFVFLHYRLLFFFAAALDKPQLKVLPYKVVRVLKCPQVDQLKDELFSGGSLLTVVRP